MRTKLTLLIILLFTSCSIFQKKELDYSEAYVTGKGIGLLDSDSIRKNLYRKLSMAGGNYQIKAFPITRAYIDSYVREQATLRSLRKSEHSKLVNAYNKKFLERTVCIEAEISVKEFEQVGNLSQWSLTLIDSNNIAYKLAWMPEPPFIDKIPPTITMTRNSYHGKEKMWNLRGKACAEADVEMKKGFKVVFKPSFVQWPFSDEIQEEWSFNYSEVVEGKEVFKKKKERRKEAYRGW